MFYYVNGTVAHMAPYLAVIDCGGVGYACRTTNNTLARLKKGEKAKLYTYLNVREDAMELYAPSFPCSANLPRTRAASTANRTPPTIPSTPCGVS